MTKNEQHVQSPGLSVEDLSQVVGTCAGLDPGPDPAWDPDEYPGVGSADVVRPHDRQ
jgi:hypothetical protein